MSKIYGSATAGFGMPKTLIETKIAELNKLLSALDLSIESRVTAKIDPTLSITDMAADAKITGDAISNLESKIFVGTTDEYNTAYTNGTIQNGSIVILTDKSVGYIPGVIPDDDETSAVLGVAVLGQMILQ